MTLRTPRRRISPRTRRKFQAIKNFIRRALGTSSQPDTKTCSSIEISVSDLKSKITDIEQQLTSVSKTCQDLSSIEQSFRKESENSLLQSQQNIKALRYTENSTTTVNDIKTKLLYKSSNHQDRSLNKKYSACANQHDDVNEMSSANQSVAQEDGQDLKLKQENIEFENKRREKDEYGVVRKKRTHSKYKTIGPTYSKSSFHSLGDKGYKYSSKPGYSRHHRKRHSRKEYTEPLISSEHRNKETFQNDLRNNERGHSDKHKSKRTKRVYSEVDKDFIEAIIKKQYKPVKLFGRRDSDFSQFSAPVCRDQEFKIHDDIQEDIELCSCCFDKCRSKRHHYARHSDVSDMRSICDTRLYSSNRNRCKQREIKDYNNSALYDVVPVREKTSPKTRRKFTEEYNSYQCCKEVPPSPRSNRPRLNLKVQRCAEYEDSLYNERLQDRRKSPTRDTRRKILNMIESDVSSECYPQRKQPIIYNKEQYRQPVLPEEDVVYNKMRYLQHPKVTKEQINISNNDTTLNTQVTDSAIEKPDKTLSEIKDILKTFLLEIKKESSLSDKSGVTSKIDNKLTHHEQKYENTNNMPNSGDISNNYRQIQSFLPAFPNPYCYPILPVCPMNCMQNGYVISSPSYTCNMCAKTSKQNGHVGNDSSNNKSTPAEEMNETQELIKEIYKFVSQKPKYPQSREYDYNSARSKSEHLLDKNLAANRYSGDSKPSKHDAKIGTSHLKCYSKSCEALGSRIPSDTYNTNGRYSDTFLDKLSLEVTQSLTETDLSANIPEEKVKQGTLSKVLNSMKLFRNKKKDVVDEMSESEGVVEVEDNLRSPFKQHIQSYAMHGQEYYNAPPTLGPHSYPPLQKPLGQNYPNQLLDNNLNNSHYNHHLDRAPAPQCCSKHLSAPPYPNYDPRYNQIPPQVPLCLKEIEMKSIGTQSDRKKTILQKIIKMPRQQASPGDSRHAVFEKQNNNFWKTLQDNANQNQTMNFPFKTQGDMNLKNAMIKKLFYKRNPFSPSNMIMRTLLGKDKSSYMNPPKLYKPRMFF